jgi:perosamine synthetase
MNLNLAKGIEKVIQKHFSIEYANHLNRPLISQKAENNLISCISSGNLSTEGKYLDRSENEIATLSDSKFSLCTITGSSALHLALLAIGVGPGDEVLTTSFSFIATTNAIIYAGAKPVFLDIEEDHLTLDPKRVEEFLKNHSFRNSDGQLVNKRTGNFIKAVLPVHVFGIAADIDQLLQICQAYDLPLVEDAAQAMGSRYLGKQLGTFGDAGIFSFNGNKIITSGQGGAMITNQKGIFEKALSLSTNAKSKDLNKREYETIGYNYRMANVNAALLLNELGCLENKIAIRKNYWEDLKEQSEGKEFDLLAAREYCEPNFWQIAIRFREEKNKASIQDQLLSKSIMASNPWPLIHLQKPYKNFERDDLKISEKIPGQILLLPSTPDLSFKLLPYFRAEMA